MGSTTGTGSRPPRVGLVVADRDVYGPHDHDTVPLRAALAELGVEAVEIEWTTTAFDPSTVDLLVVRSPWDYAGKVCAFDTWLSSAAQQVPVLNGPDLIRWNMDKRYLVELEAAGVPVIPTAYCASPGEVQDALFAARDGSVVVKPTVSAGAELTGLFLATDPAAGRLAADILDAGKQVMVQPEVASLTAGDERALFYFDGRYSHTVGKGAILARGGGFAGGTYTENPVRVEPTAGLREVAEAALREIAVRFGTPLYARLDVVDDVDLGPVLIEAEVFEPALFLADDQGDPTGAASRYAAAILARTRETGATGIPVA
ncbi:hypothetical protein GCM10025865_20590 [Paraoerskovia sediminicola]|uniref:ATP-grasp domain-containing protein n=1 Tax=Paraoerskovia sediminicola TaxID=1138587 RepID=A0ABM8G3Y4_9CELL|nr:hypothetical protein [Paraoerskovia sediminicola]BDZ42760.1 hypothetical protein GCM10025865_20590 [Paraoerskovia sediminicola]